MKTTTLRFLLSVAGYIIPTMILGMVWHYVLFPDLYDGMGIYNRSNPLIPMGLGSMLMQGVIMAYLYPFYAGKSRALRRSIGFSWVMGLFMYSVSTLATGAKIEVSPMSTWLMVQLGFHMVQFTVAGVFIGLAHSVSPRPSATADGHPLPS